MTDDSTGIDWDALVEAATEARERAYAPYSRYRVGAAALGDDGVIYRGCNVENASYGLCLCAERTALATAVAAGCRAYRALVVCTAGERPAAPCGMCRQVMVELGPSFPVRCVTVEGGRLDTSVEELQPYAFDGGYLDG